MKRLIGFVVDKLILNIIILPQTMAEHLKRTVEAILRSHTAA